MNTFYKKLTSRSSRKSKSFLSKKGNSKSHFFYKNYQSSSINNYKNTFSLEYTTKSTNINNNINRTKNNCTFESKGQYDNSKNINILSYVASKNNSNKDYLKNSRNVFSKRIMNLRKSFNYRKINNVISNQNKTQLKKEKEKNNKICVLPNYLKINNFNLKTSKILEYLDLNKNNNFFICENKIIKPSKSHNFTTRRKFLNKAKSVLNINKLKKIEEIYPTVLNIEGHKNRKLLSEFKIKEKKKIRTEKSVNVYSKRNFEMRKKMFKEKWKAEEYSKADISDMAYRRQLLIISMKLYQKAIKHLQKKNSYKVNLDLPLYNVFLDLD